MMKSGQIKAILNSDILLVETNEDSEIGEEFQVFTEIQDERLLKLVGSGILQFPVGHIRITANQGNRFYLAERFRENKSVKSIVTKPPEFFGALSRLQPRVETVERIEHGPWSAVLDENASLGIDPPVIIGVGDFLAPLNT